MAINDRSVLKPGVREYYERLLLMTAYPNLVYQKFGQRRNIPAKMGDTAVFRRYAKLSTVPIPLVSGVTPPGATLSTTDIKARADWYGNFVMITDDVEWEVEDRVLNESVRLLAQNMGETLDELTRDVLASTTSVLQCSNGVNGSTPTEMTSDDIKAAVKTLVGNDARMIAEIIDPSQNFGTAPVRKAFFGFIHTDLLDDLENVSNFLDVSEYGSRANVLNEEWGATGHIRWLPTSIALKSSAATPVYSNIIVGQEAYGCVSLGPENGEFYVEEFGSAGSADPLHQRGTVGWKIPYVARILNDAFMQNLMCTHS